MRTIEKTIYKFNELNEAAKERAIKDQINFEQENFVLDLSHHKEELKEKGFNSPQIFYSGFCSQGDGASFDAEIDLTYFVTKYKDYLPMLSKRLDRLENYIYSRIRKNSHSNRYSHKKTRYAEVVIQHANMRIENVLQKEVTELENLIEQDRLAACDRIYRSLENEWDYVSTKENAEEIIEANEYEFYEDGSLFS